MVARAVSSRTPSAGSCRRCHHLTLSEQAYGQGFTVETPDAGTVTRGTLIRAGSVTHAFNETQLIIPLTFTRQGPTTLGARAPANGITAPPGPYLLFLLDPNGVPSIGSIVTVGP
jgi:hypothetical protein